MGYLTGLTENLSISLGNKQDLITTSTDIDCNTLSSNYSSGTYMYKLEATIDCAPSEGGTLNCTTGLSALETKDSEPISSPSEPFLIDN